MAGMATSGPIPTPEVVTEDDNQQMLRLLFKNHLGVSRKQLKHDPLWQALEAAKVTRFHHNFLCLARKKN